MIPWILVILGVVKCFDQVIKIIERFMERFIRDKISLDGKIKKKN